MTERGDSDATLEDFRARALAMWGEERAADIDETVLRKTAAAVDRMHGLSLEIGSGPGFYLGEFSQSGEPVQPPADEAGSPADHVGDNE